MKKLILIIGLLFFSNTCFAQEQQYAYNRSIIYVFYDNSNCTTCKKAVQMLTDLYNKKYFNRFDFYVINYEEEYKENNYIKTYQLSKPLEVVMAKVRNGRADGWRKIDNLENRVSNKITFEREASSRIDVFLGSGFTP